MPLNEIWKSKPMESDNKFLRSIDTVWIVINRINVFFLIVWLVMFILVLLTSGRSYTPAVAAPEEATA